MADGDASPQVDSQTRRRYIALLGVTGGAALAGCPNPPESDDEPDETTEDPEDMSPDEEPATAPGVHDAFFRTRHARVSPDQWNWNPVVDWFVLPNRYAIFAQWTQYLVGQDRFYPHLLRDWTHEDGELILTLSDSFRWAKTGEPVDADDLALQLEVYEAADMPATRFVEAATATGEFELTVTYPSGTNAELVEYTLLPQLADVPPSRWQDEALDSDPSEIWVRDPDASGPLFLTKLGRDEAHAKVRRGLDKATDHALADHYNWKGYNLRYYGGSERHTVLSEGDDGAVNQLAGDLAREEMPDSMRELQFPAGFGMGFWFNHERDLWQHRRAREAFVHTIDCAGIIEELSGIPKRQHPAPTGLTAPSVERWLGSRVPDGFDTYDGGPEEGARRLEEVGYEPADIDLTLTFPQGWSDWATASQAAIDQLEAAGWNAAANPEDGGPSHTIEDGEFDVVAYPHAPGTIPQVHYPFFSFEHIFRGSPREEGHFANYDPGTVSIDGQSIDVEAELDRLASTSAQRAEQRPIVERLARVVNQDVPCAIVMEHVAQSFINTAQFDLPEDSPHLESYWPQYWLPKVNETMEGYDRPGLLKYDGEPRSMPR